MTAGRIPSIEGGIQPTIVDAKGDLIAAVAADTPARLAIGANDTVLTADSTEATGMKWAAPAGGGASWTLLNAGGTALTGAATVTVSGISGINKLMVILTKASSANASAGINIRLNTDTGNNYIAVANQFIATATGTDLTQAAITAVDSETNRIQVGVMGADASRAVFGGVTIDGCNTANLKPYIVIGGGNAGNGTQRSYEGMGHYAGTSVISSVSAFSGSGNFDDGTMFIYGSAV